MNGAILTSYFTKKIHPNDPNDGHVIGRMHNNFVKNNEFLYIKDWYNSVSKNNLKGFIFHDDLSEEFVTNYETKNITFIKVQPSEYSNNDYRFFCFSKFLKENKFDYVFHADVSDVVVVRDPKTLLKENQDYTYFACRDSIKICQFPYLQIHEKYQWRDKLKLLLNIKDWDLINMGVIGGKYHDMVLFYDKFCEIRSDMGSKDFNCNMWLCQYLLRFIFEDRNTLIGDPVCSEFKQYQKDRKDVYFIHK